MISAKPRMISAGMPASVRTAASIDRDVPALGCIDRSTERLERGDVLAYDAVATCDLEQHGRARVVGLVRVVTEAG